MPFKQGKIVDSFSVKGKDGKEIKAIFRYPRKGDARACLKLVNFIRREADYLGSRKMETLKSERKWLEDRLKEMRQGRAVILLVEVDGELVGDSSIIPVPFDTSSHVGTFGIMLKEEFTGLGIGKRLARKTLQLAKSETGYRIIESGYFAPNKRSRGLHKSLGFRQYGVFPKESRLRDGGYCDHVYVYKQIKKM